MERRRLIKLFATLVWVAANGIWLFYDRLIQDGDEMGHVGAAELFVSRINNEGLFAFVEMAHHGEMGEYPPFFAAVVGMWWSMVGQPPDDMTVRAIGLMFIWIAAMSISAFVKRLDGPFDLAYVLTLSTPLFIGLGRHYMPETLLTTLCALFAACAMRYKQTPNAFNAIIAGTVFGFGMLTKQTYFFTAAPLLVLFWGNGIRLACLSLVSALVIALPWYLIMFHSQMIYLEDSAAANQSANAFQHILAAASILSWDVLGPALTIGLFIAINRAFKSKNKELGWLFIWLAVSFLIFLIIPKKYPRLMLGLTPALIAIISLGLKSQPKIAWLIAIGSVSWTTIGSLYTLPLNKTLQMIDDRCPQIWLRPASNNDVGYSAVADALSGGNMPKIAVINPPSIPCSIQSAHDWIIGLDPYLRHHGIDANIVVTKTVDQDDWKTADLQIVWHGSASESPLPMSIEVNMDRDHLKR